MSHLFFGHIHSPLITGSFFRAFFLPLIPSDWQIFRTTFLPIHLGHPIRPLVIGDKRPSTFGAPLDEAALGYKEFLNLLKPSVVENQPVPASVHLNFLDGIRGGAALWITLAHSMLWGGWFFVRLPGGKFTEIFMLQTGFLLTYLAYLKPSHDPTVSKASAFKFILRRFFRVAPLYYVVLLSTYACAASYTAGFVALQAANPDIWANANPAYLAGNTQHGLTHFLLHVTFLFGMFPEYAFTPLLPDWIIGLLMQFYVVFPILFYLFQRCGPLTAAVLIYGAGAGLRMCFNHLDFPEPTFLPLGINIFLIGMLIASASHKFHEQPGYRAGLILAALCLSLPSSTYISLLVALIFCLTIRMESTERGLSLARRGLEWCLGNRLARFMADTSYGVLLVHGFFISYVGGWMCRQPDLMKWHPAERVALLMAITVLGSYAVGYVLYRWVEKPGIKLGQKLLSKKSPA